MSVKFTVFCFLSHTYVLKCDRTKNTLRTHTIIRNSSSSSILTPSQRICCKLNSYAFIPSKPSRKIPHILHFMLNAKWQPSNRVEDSCEKELYKADQHSDFLENTITYMRIWGRGFRTCPLHDSLPCLQLLYIVRYILWRHSIGLNKITVGYTGNYNLKSRPGSPNMKGHKIQIRNAQWMHTTLPSLHFTSRFLVALDLSWCKS